MASETNGSGTGSSTPLTFTLDTKAPVITAALTADTGVAGDKITKSPSLSGTGDAGALVTFTEGTTKLGTAIANASGAWTFLPTGLADGLHTIKVSETDAAGNIGTATLTFTLDTTAPVVTEVLTTDTGVAGDKITKSPGLSGTGEAKALVTFTEGTTKLGTATAGSTGAWTYAPTGLADGLQTIKASETDAAGNIGTATLTFTLDTTAPVLTEALTADTGLSATDKFTKSPNLSGTGDANAVVSFTEGTTVLGSTTAGSTRAWTYAPSGLADGAHTIVASETDAAGNKGTATLTFTLDTKAPVVALMLTADTGSSQTDRITSNPSLFGTGEANSVVALTEGTTLLGTTTADASGAWTYVPVSLIDGAHTIGVADAAGNTGSATLTFTLDTKAPVLTEVLTTDTGSSATDKITSNPSLSGTGEANTVVTFTIDNIAATTTATADASGKYTYTPTGLADGAHTIVATGVADVAGNKGTASLTFTLDTKAPAVSITSVGGFTNQAAKTITGTAEVGASVKIFNGATQVATATVKTDGTWSAALTLAKGSNVISAKATDLAGNTGASAAVTSTLYTVTWLGSSADDWMTATNWSMGRLPGTSDVVLINLPVTVTDAMGTSTVAQLYTAAGSTLALTGAQLNVTGTAAIAGALSVSSGGIKLSGASSVGSLAQSGGVLNGGGTVTVTGTSALSGGTESGTGTTIAQGGASFTTSNFGLDGSRTLQLGGASTATGSYVAIDLNGYNPNMNASDAGAGTLKIAGGATFEDKTTDNGFTVNASYKGDTDTGSTAAVVNQGTFKKTGTATTSTIYAAFNNSGTVNVARGTLVLAGGGTDTGGSYTGAGTVEFSGGTRTLNSASSVTSGVNFSGGQTTIAGSYASTGKTTLSGGTATFSAAATMGSLAQSGGVLNGGGTVTVTGTSALSGGTESGAGTTIAQGGASFTTSNFGLDGGRILQLGGASTATGSYVAIDLNSYNPNTNASDAGAGTLKIAGGATFEDKTTDNGFTVNASYKSDTDTGLTAAVVNQGTFKKTGTATTSTIYAAFNNSGTVNVARGTLDLQAGASNTGTMDIGPGAKLQVDAALTGIGTVNIHGTGSVMELGAASSNAFVFTDTAAATLRIDHSSSFAGSIKGFVSKSILDLADMISGSASLSYMQTQGGGMLTVTDGSAHTASLAFVGSYVKSDFVFSSDNAGGTFIKHA